MGITITIEQHCERNKNVFASSQCQQETLVHVVFKGGFPARHARGPCGEVVGALK